MTVFDAPSAAAASEGELKRADRRQAILVVVFWLLMFLTLTPLEREDVSGADSLDLLAACKLVVRLGSLALLSGMLAANWREARRFGGYFFPVATFVAWAGLSVAWSALPSISTGQLASLIVLSLLSWNVALQGRDARATDVWLLAMSGGLAVFSAGMLVAYSVYSEGSGVYNDGSGERFDFGLAHPTMAAGTASLGILLSLATAMWRRTAWVWAGAAASLVVHGGVLLLAHNRTAVLVACLTISAVVAVWSSWRTLGRWALGLSLVTLAATVCDPGWRGVRRVQASVSQFLMRDQTVEQLTAFSGRMELWQEMWASFRRAPWAGHGYFVTSPEGELTIWHRTRNFNAHNMPFQALVANGLIGAVLFCWMLWRPVAQAIWRAWDGGESGRRSWLFLLISLWMWTWGMTDAALLGPVAPFCVTFFVIWGLEARAAIEARLPAGFAPGSAGLPVAASATGGFVL